MQKHKNKNTVEQIKPWQNNLKQFSLFKFQINFWLDLISQFKKLFHY